MAQQFHSQVYLRRKNGNTASKKIHAPPVYKSIIYSRQDTEAS